MAIITTSVMDAAVGTRYTQKYQRAAVSKRLYDQLAGNVMTAPQFDLEQRRGLGTTYTFNFASDMAIGTTAISESADITPQTLVDTTSTITPTSLGEALKWSELLDLEAYTDFIAFRAEKIGENAMESIEWLAIKAALQGNLVIREAARASLDAGTASNLWSEAAVWEAAATIAGLKCPPLIDGNGQKKHIAIAHSDAFYDLFHGGNVQSALIYGGLPGNILLNGELGEIANFKLVISPHAKVFGGAGADNGTGAANSAYTLTTAAVPLDKTLAVTTGTNLQYGRLFTVGTEETSSTFYQANERVKWVSGTTTATIVGSGANGGVRFAHTTSEYCSNNDSVYPVAYGGPNSLAKVFASDVGEFGQLVGPLYDGLANQWQSLAWKFYGGYGRVAENYILRGEYASSLDSDT